jgi:hypothetical protein
MSAMSLILLLPALNLLHWATAFTLAGLAYYCYKQRRLQAAPALSLFLGLSAYWALWAAVIFLVPDLESKIFLNRIKLLPIPFIPLSIFYVIYSIQNSFKIPKWGWGCLSIIPSTSALITLSPFYDLFITDYALKNYFGHDVLIFSNGPWFQIHNIQSRLLIVFSLISILTFSQNQNFKGKHKKWLLFFAIFLPFVADSIAVFYFEFLRYIQITPTALVLTALTMFYAIFKDGILNVVPYARSLILDNTSDIHLVFNANNQLVDFNKAAQYSLGLSHQSIHKSLSEIKKYCQNLNNPIPQF